MLIDMFRQEHKNKWRTEVIDSLNISTCRMPNREDEQYPNKHSVQYRVSKQADFGKCPINILLYLLHVRLLENRHVFLVVVYYHFCAEVVLHHVKVFFSFALESRLLKVLVYRHIIKHELPDCCAEVRITFQSLVHKTYLLGCRSMPIFESRPSLNNPWIAYGQTFEFGDNAFVF